MRREEPIGGLSLCFPSLFFDWADRQRTKETARQKVTTGMRFIFFFSLSLDRPLIKGICKADQETEKRNGIVNPR